LVEPDEVSGDRQVTDRLAIIRKKRVMHFNQCPLKPLSLIRYSKMVRANAGETRGAPMGRDERETACYALVRHPTSASDNAFDLSCFRFYFWFVIYEPQ